MSKREWKPWIFYAGRTPDKLIDLNEPPCKWCCHWNPEIKFCPSPEGQAFDGVVCCHAEDQHQDFSCYKAKEEVKP